MAEGTGDASLPDYESPKPRRGTGKVAKYKCKCGNQWKVYNSRGETKICPICREMVAPYKTRWAKDGERGYRRLFGRFHCSACNNEWASGNAWNGKGQQCRTCKSMIMPHDLRPLRWTPRQEKRKPHESELCERCKELGHNCREFDSEDASDDVSVVSTDSFSTDAGSAIGNSDEERTPVPSDTEDTIDDMVEELDLLKLNK